MAEPVIISRESDLWELLSAAVSGERELPPADLLHIIGWRPELLYFPDEPVGHSLSPTLARAVTGYHASLCRAFAYLAYGRPNGTLLRSEDRDALDIRMLVVEGSNGLQIMDKALEGLTHAILTKISGRQMTLLLVLFLILNFGSTTTVAWLHEEYAAKEHEVDTAQQIKLSAEETERMHILASALNLNPNLKPLATIAEEGKVPLLRGTLAYNRARVLGNEITREQAQVIISREKDKGQSERLDGRFEVIEIDTENPEGWMGTLRNLATHQEIKVSINRGELPEADTQTLFDALRGKSSVDALVNAWTISGKIQYASIVRADKPKP